MNLIEALKGFKASHTGRLLQVEREALQERGTCDVTWCSVMFEELWNVLFINQAAATFISSPSRPGGVTR